MSHIIPFKQYILHSANLFFYLNHVVSRSLSDTRFPLSVFSVLYSLPSSFGNDPIRLSLSMHQRYRQNERTNEQGAVPRLRRNDVGSRCCAAVTSTAWRQHGIHNFLFLPFVVLSEVKSQATTGCSSIIFARVSERPNGHSRCSKSAM